jgi:hypothetical protein
MSEFKHTPGPWLIDEEDNLIRATDDRGTLICNLGGNSKNPAVMADARLIAAAPAMYEYIASSASNGCVEATKIMEAIHACR